MTPPARTSTLFPYTTLFRSNVFATTRSSLPSPSKSPVTSHDGMPAAENGVLKVNVPSPFPRRVWTDPPKNEMTRSSRSEEHTSELQSPYDLVCRLLLEKKKR